MTEKLTPIVKFNGGRGAILCNGCAVIIKQDLDPDEFRGRTDLLFCKDCGSKQLRPCEVKEAQ